MKEQVPGVRRRVSGGKTGFRSQEMGERLQGGIVKGEWRFANHELPSYFWPARTPFCLLPTAC